MAKDMEATLLCMWKIAEVMPHDNLFYGFDWIGGDADLGRDRVRVNIKEMRKHGLVEFARGLMDDEGMVAGSGYAITSKGVEWRESIILCETCEQPRRIHICWSCGDRNPVDPKPGAGCINCRNTGWDQTPCLPPERREE